MFFTFLIYLSNLVSIEYYLLYDLYTYILCIILKYKNLQFKQFIDDISLDFWFFRNFASMEDIRRIYNSIMDLSKFTSNKKILAKVVILNYN